MCEEWEWEREKDCLNWKKWEKSLHRNVYATREVFFLSLSRRLLLDRLCVTWKIFVFLPLFFPQQVFKRWANNTVSHAHMDIDNYYSKHCNSSQKKDGQKSYKDRNRKTKGKWTIATLTLLSNSFSLLSTQYNLSLTVSSSHRPNVFCISSPLSCFASLMWN